MQLRPMPVNQSSVQLSLQAALDRYDNDPDLQAMYPDRAEFEGYLNRREMKRYAAESYGDETYHVLKTCQPPIDPVLIWLSFKRHDREVITSHADIQMIKSQMLGQEATAFELFPAESRLTDSANQYHLWHLTGRRIFNLSEGHRAFVEVCLKASTQRRLLGHNLWIYSLPELPEITYIGVANRDRPKVRDWRILQQIKNKIVGPNHEGFELFPADDECPNDGRFHLLVFNDPSFRIPVGFDQRFVSDRPMGNAVNRELD